MTTKLDAELKREVLIDGQPYTLSLSTIGLKLTLKGKRLGIELLWKDLVTGDAALATALQASVIANAHRNLREPLSTASPKALKKAKASLRKPRR